MPTPLSKVKNFGPVCLPELEAMGLTTVEQLQELGWEDVCRRWVQYFPERLNVNAFVGVIATIEGMVWTKITRSQKAMARRLANELRTEHRMPPVKPKKRKRR